MVRSRSKRFCGSKVDSEFAEKNGLRDWKLASCLLKNLCFTGRLFILCDARILRRPAIQWESASTLSAAKSSCRSGWRWGINRMIMSRNRDTVRRCIKKQAPNTGACLVNIVRLNALNRCLHEPTTVPR